ncbi:MAG: hypothetical protein GOV15_01850, partial [Candidatus Diapherotrites archaeon]|nr:hypothetical protein [Candidatus Diapherotrites archaeon]
MRCVLIPSSFSADEKNDYIRSFRIGILARLFTVFGVDRVVVYLDKDPHVSARKLGQLIVKQLRYLNTPAYLRKAVFPLDKDLASIGVVPPIKGPHHEPEFFGLRFRFGVVTKVRKDGLTVDCGLESNLRVSCKEAKSVRDIVLIDLNKNQVVGKEKVPGFFGFDVNFDERPLNAVLKDLKKDGFELIGTSRKGVSLKESVLKKIKKSGKRAVVFGSAFRGLNDLLTEKESKYLFE